MIVHDLDYTIFSRGIMIAAKPQRVQVRVGMPDPAIALAAPISLNASRQ
jgi:hypothetical protein